MKIKDLQPYIKKLKNSEKKISNAINVYENMEEKIFNHIKKDVENEIRKKFPKAKEITSHISSDPEWYGVDITFTITIDGEPEHISIRKEEKYYKILFESKLLNYLASKSGMTILFLFRGNKKEKSC